MRFLRPFAQDAAAALKSARAAMIAGLIVIGAPAEAQTPAPTAQSDEKTTHQNELRGVEDTMRASEEQRRRIEADVEALKADRSRLNAALIETTARVQENERQANAANQRLATLTDTEGAMRKSLDNRRGVIADVLAVLQRMGRDPPPAILVRPQDMAQAIRAAILLGAVVPELRAETQALADDLDELAKLRKSIAAEQADLAKRAQGLAEGRKRLAALIEARQQSLAEAEQALNAERDRAADLARQAATLKDLIAGFEGQGGAGKAGADSTRQGDSTRQSDEAAAAEVQSRAAAAQARDPARLKPVLAFADAKGTLDLPAAGTIVKAFGASDAYGGIEKGVSIATPSSATVSSPVDGSIVFSGPYRSYGQLLIINAGSGYYVVLAGMDRINVVARQFVLAGEPVGTMGGGTTRTATSVAIGAAQPILYIEFRKDGAAIDPGPWWTKADIEKARG
jgi:septal ring factor EnvC (AmiA/AmiB activator)